ncbi:DNA/RNA non-specific endonuclease [Chryseobacterium gambrini]|uniref:DNA/RNA non-specific endonuclease n=1 Tax=Chryseobacterium gambrini TaxID=373672 RepID=UPI003BAABFC1
MMESLIIESTDLVTSEKITESALRDPDFSNREGYNINFLNTSLPLPMVDDNLRYQIAINQQPSKNGKLFLDYTNFSVLFNKDKKLPFYSAVNIEGKSNEIARVHDERGSNPWRIDNRLEVNGNNFQFTNDDYTNSGFQRGHMVRFYDPAWGKTEDKRKIAMGDTFHFTNCCPQVGKFNAGLWNDLEDYYMARSIFQDNKISVFTGPIFNKAKLINDLLVPLNFWKVIVYNKGNEIEAIGFLISHEIAMQKMLDEVMSLEVKRVDPSLKAEDIERLFNKKDLKKWTVKIKLIEEKTGIKFGLNDVDINRNERLLFYANTNHINHLHLATEFDEFIAKNETSDLINEVKRMKQLMRYNRFVNEQQKRSVDYTKFIQNI